MLIYLSTVEGKPSSDIQLLKDENEAQWSANQEKYEENNDGAPFE